MSMGIKRTFLLMVFFFTGSLHAVSVIVLNDGADVASSKKILLKFVLDEHEQGILKTTLQFSVDQGDVRLVSWNALSQPTDFFSSPLKKTQRVFSESFTGCLAYETNFSDVSACMRLLGQTKVYVSCFIVRKNGKTKPFNTMLSISQGQVMEKEEVIDTHGDDQPYQLPSFLPVPDLAQDFEPIEQLGSLWTSFCNRITKALFGNTFFWWYSLILLLFVAYMLKRRFVWLCMIAPLQGMWEREFVVLLGFVVMNGLLYGAHYVIGMPYVLYACSALYGLGMMYVLLSSTQEALFLGRLKSLIGLVLGSMMLPVMLKAYLMQHGL